jgi:hypothetical protein
MWSQGVSSGNRQGCGTWWVSKRSSSMTDDILRELKKLWSVQLLCLTFYRHCNATRWIDTCYEEERCDVGGRSRSFCMLCTINSTSSGSPATVLRMLGREANSLLYPRLNTLISQHRHSQTWVKLSIEDTGAVSCASKYSLWINNMTHLVRGAQKEFGTLPYWERYYML